MGCYVQGNTDANLSDRMNGHPNLRIAIIGGGVCGVACAVALAKNGVKAHIYEAKVSVVMSCSPVQVR